MILKKATYNHLTTKSVRVILQNKTGQQDKDWRQILDMDPNNGRFAYVFNSDGTENFSCDVNRRGFNGRYEFPITYQVNEDVVDVFYEKERI